MEEAVSINKHHLLVGCIIRLTLFSFHQHNLTKSKTRYNFFFLTNYVYNIDRNVFCTLMKCRFVSAVLQAARCRQEGPPVALPTHCTLQLKKLLRLTTAQCWRCLLSPGWSTMDSPIHHQFFSFPLISVCDSTSTANYCVTPQTGHTV